MTPVIYAFPRHEDGPNKTLYATHINELQAAIEEISARASGVLMRWKPGRYYSIQQIIPMNTFANTLTLTANSIYATPLFVPPGSGAIDQVGVAVQAGAGTNSRLMYFAPGADGHPGALGFDFGTVNTSTAGDKVISGSRTLPEGPGFLAIVPDAAITVYMFQVGGPGLLGNSSQAGNAGSVFRANGGTSAPNPFGTGSLSYIADQYVRLAVRAA